MKKSDDHERRGGRNHLKDLRSRRPKPFAALTQAQTEGFLPVETAQILGVFVVIAEKASTSKESVVH